jgi:hypothetical protein
VDECVSRLVKILGSDAEWTCSLAKVKACATAYASISCDADSNPDPSCAVCGFGKSK